MTTPDKAQVSDVTPDTGSSGRATVKAGERWPGDTRPPFEEGNTVGLRHGARSPRVVLPLAAALKADLIERCPWLADVDDDELDAWSYNAAKVRLLRTWEDEHGLLSDEALKAATELDKAEKRAASARANLALNPTARARLLATLSTATAGGGGETNQLEALKAEGRRFIEAHTAGLLAGEPPDDHDEEIDG